MSATLRRTVPRQLYVQSRSPQSGFPRNVRCPFITWTTGQTSDMPSHYRVKARTSVAVCSVATRLLRVMLQLVCGGCILNLARGEAVDALCTERSKDTTVPSAAANTRERRAMAEDIGPYATPDAFR